MMTNEETKGTEGTEGTPGTAAMNRVPCPECRRAMRLWALDARRATTEGIREVCLTAAIGFRDGPCFHEQFSRPGPIGPAASTHTPTEGLPSSGTTQSERSLARAVNGLCASGEPAFIDGKWQMADGTRVRNVEWTRRPACGAVSLAPAECRGSALRTHPTDGGSAPHFAPGCIEDSSDPLEQGQIAAPDGQRNTRIAADSLPASGIHFTNHVPLETWTSAATADLAGLAVDADGADRKAALNSRSVVGSFPGPEVDPDGGTSGMGRVESGVVAPREIPGRAPCLAGAALPHESEPGPARALREGKWRVAEGNGASEADWMEANARAQLCDRFLARRAEGVSLRQAARELGRSAATFSGDDSLLARYQRGGVAALLPERRECGRKATFEVPEWFVPAARFFWLLTNRTWNSGSVPEAIRRTISLPHLPVGWQAPTERRLLRALGLEAVPECSIELRERILARQASGLELVPERLARQITAPEAVVIQRRHPKNADLNYLCAPGTMMRRQGEEGHHGKDGKDGKDGSYGSEGPRTMSWEKMNSPPRSSMVKVAPL